MAQDCVRFSRPVTDAVFGNTMKAICLAAALATLSFSAVAKTPDDPVLGQKLAAIADFLYMRPLCETAGYAVDPDSAEKIMTPAMAQAAAAGIKPETAEAMAQAAITIRQFEGDRIARNYGDAYTAATESSDVNAPSIALNNWRRFVDGKCYALSVSAEFRDVITAPVAVPPADISRGPGKWLIDHLHSRSGVQPAEQ
jgi:hypothetical protein